MFKVKVITPIGVYNELDATILNIISIDGMRGVLSNHMPLVTMIDIGIMTIGNDQANPPYRKDYTTGTGVLYFCDNVATVLVETIESSDEIDIQRAMDALKRSESRMAIINKQDVDFERARRAYRRAKNRLNLGNRK